MRALRTKQLLRDNLFLNNERKNQTNTTYFPNENVKSLFNLFGVDVSGDFEEVMN
tara:strand:- start:338 stop:502 length:165 start_codon:yes stop_codon:yes gene_type:complete